MGKHSGYDIYWNYPGDKLAPGDWSASKAGAARRVEQVFSRITRTPDTKLVVVAVDPDTGEIVAGKMEPSR